MHLLVRSDIPLGDAHLISHRVSKKLKDEYEDILDVVVHLEPSLQHQESNYKKNN
jgi:divalent metal cation (Fe/Co/Zn/Cd) transporter